MEAMCSEKDAVIAEKCVSITGLEEQLANFAEK